MSFRAPFRPRRRPTAADPPEFAGWTSPQSPPSSPTIDFLDEPARVTAPPPPKTPHVRSLRVRNDRRLVSDCVILAVDTARLSGWCVRDAGGVGWGTIDMRKDPEAAEELCSIVVAQAKARRVREVLVLESPFRGNSQGTEIGTWRNAWYRANGTKARVVLVNPSTWRAAVLPRGAVTMKREEVRPMELSRANAIVLAGDTGSIEVDDHDAAAAICISEWARLAPKVLEMVTFKRRPK